MKTLVRLYLLLFMPLMFVACGVNSGGDGGDNGDGGPFELVVEELKCDNPLIYGTGGEVDLSVQASSIWSAKLLDNRDKSWVTLSQSGSSLNIKTAQNNTKAERETSILITCGDIEHTVQVRQLRNIFRREEIGTRRVRNELRGEYIKNALSQLVVILPIPTSNIYQDISDLSFSDGEQLMAGDGVTPYLYRCMSGSSAIPESGETLISEEFTIKNYRVYVDFDAITSYVDIDTDSEPYRLYTGSSGDIIDPNNATIVQLAESLWAESNNDIVEYARLAYMWVAKNMSYINPNTGLHPVADILANGGGDCGNQATVFNSLMRNRNIPARHIVMVRTDGTFHVRSEFYLAGYGWIPVDANAKNMMPLGDFFGIIESNEIVVNSNINLTLKVTDRDSATLALLQNYAYWYWCTAEPYITLYHQVRKM